MSTITFVDIVTFRIPIVDDDAGEVVCVPKVNHPPGVFAPVRVWESAVTSTHAWVGVSVDGPSGWESTTPVSYTLTCGLVVCNISCNNKENKCVLARPGEYVMLSQICIQSTTLLSTTLVPAKTTSLVLLVVCRSISLR